MTYKPTSNEIAPASTAKAASEANRTVVVACLAGLAVMSGVTAYSPTLYKIFCRVTGYGGTTQRVVAQSTKIVDRVITVRFDANVSPNLAWKFEPVQNTMDVKLGENAIAFFRATNLSDKPLTGSAAFNVAPDVMGLYFNKIQCFCFTEQTLQPHQSVEMPVTFYVDPKMLADRDTRDLGNVALSYVFYPVAKPTNKTAAAETLKVPVQ